jgi:hypothetical protein
MDENERRALARAASGTRPVGAFIGRLLDPVARARGFATTTLLSEWPAIVGSELAEFTAPDRVVWPRRLQEGEEAAAAPRGWRDGGAILVLRVDGPRAIEVQHRSSKILERVNTHFGYRAITEMRILQAPVARSEPTSPVPTGAKDSIPLPFSASIEHEGLRRALARLGAAARSKLTRG